MFEDPFEFVVNTFDVRVDVSRGLDFETSLQERFEYDHGNRKTRWRREDDHVTNQLSGHLRDD